MYLVDVYTVRQPRGLPAMSVNCGRLRAPGGRRSSAKRLDEEMVLRVAHGMKP